jgi:hypothetical protein
MEKGETYSIIVAKNAVNNSKIKDENKSYARRYGRNMCGKDKRSETLVRNTNEEKIGYGKL